MAERRALVIACEKYLFPEWSVVPYAEGSARLAQDALEKAGYKIATSDVLLGHHGTRAIIDSRLSKWLKNTGKDDAVLLYLAGRLHGRYFVAHDSLPDDVPGTALDLVDLIGRLNRSKAGSVILLLECDGHAESEALLQEACANSTKVVALLAAGAAETRLAPAKLKAGLWSHLLAEALTGTNRKAYERSGQMTALSLQRFLLDEMPRRLRKYFDLDTEQTPVLLGESHAGTVIVEKKLHESPAEDRLLDASRLRRVLFRSERTGRVKDLRDWRKTYNLPERNSPSNKKFIARIAQPELAADLESVFELCRENLGYKRKDLVLETTGGVGSLRTPDFEYTLQLDLDPGDPTQLIWRRELSRFRDVRVLRENGMEKWLSLPMESLVFEFAKPVDVEALVDRLEDAPIKGVKVHASGDGGSCEIVLAGVPGRVSVNRSHLIITGRGPGVSGLLDLFLHFLRTVGPLGEPLALQESKATH